MEAVDFGSYLKGLRKGKKLTVRQLDLYSGVSHSYISQMERGSRGIPSPDILQKLSKPLGIEYEELMKKAGYIEENKKENAFTLPESEYDRVLDEAEKEFGVSLRDDPIVLDAMRELIRRFAQMKMKK